MMQRKYKILLYAVLLTLPLLLVQCGGGREEPTPTLSPPTAVPTVPPTPTVIAAEQAETVEASSEDSADDTATESEAYPAPESGEGEAGKAVEAEAAVEEDAVEEAKSAKAEAEEAAVEPEAYPEPEEDAATEAASEESACPSVFSLDEPIFSNFTNITGTGPAGTEISISNLDEDDDGNDIYESLGEGVIAEDGTFDIELTTPIESGMFIGIQLTSWDEADATSGVLDQLMACKGNTARPNDDPALFTWDATFVNPE